MKKIILPMILLIFIMTDVANAKLLILSPNEMISHSDYIIVGKVSEKNDSDNHRKVKILIESSLKGSISEKEIILEQDKPPMYGWLNFDFPEQGTKVFLLMQKGQKGYSLTGDANSVAIIKNNSQVELYKGVNTTVQPYEEVYSLFLKENYKQDSSKSKVGPQTYNLFGYVFGGIGLILLLTFFVRRKFLK